MRGRKPTPIPIRQARGNPGKRPIPTPADVPAPERVPDPPAHLDAEAKREWRRVAPILLKAGLYSHLDRAALAAYCTTYSRWAEAEKHVSKEGAVLRGKTSGAPYQNPWLAVANKALEQIRAFEAEFGMSPSSRSRVTPAAKKEEADPFDQWEAGGEGAG